MTTVNSSVTSSNPGRRNPPRAVPFVLAARKPSRPLSMISVRVPVTPANRNYLRELRHAEPRAWQNTGSNRRLSSTRTVVSNAQREQRDLYVFGLIVAMTLTLAAVILAQSPSTAPHVTHWVSVVRHFLG